MERTTVLSESKHCKEGCDGLTFAEKREGINGEKSCLGPELANEAIASQLSDEVKSTQPVDEAGEVFRVPATLYFNSGEKASVYHVPHGVIRPLILSRLTINQLLELRVHLGSRYLFQDVNYALNAHAELRFGQGAGLELLIAQKKSHVLVI